MRKVRLVTKTGVRAHNVKSTSDYIYIPKAKAYAKITPEKAAALKLGYSVQIGKNVSIKYENAAYSLRRYENRGRISSYSTSIKAISRNIKAKRPKMLPPRIDAGVSGVAHKQKKNNARVMSRAETLENMKIFLKAKKYAIEHGLDSPRFKDYISGTDSP